MSAAPRILLEHTATVAAPAEYLFDLVAAVEHWPQFFAPAVHAEYLERDGDQDVVRRWLLAGGDRVKVLTTRRLLDRAHLRIRQEDAEPRAPRRAARVEWAFEPVGPDKTQVTLHHDVELLPDTAQDVAAAVRRETGLGAALQLTAVQEAGENRAARELLVLNFEDPLFVAGDAEDAYEMLYEADKWPERIAHVDRLEMTEDEPGIQFFDMDTRTPDGSAHTTRSVRVCLPHRVIVYKQIRLPVLLDAHTGHWRFTPTPEGLLVSARHTVTVKPSALSVLGPDTTIEDARRYLRRVLSANSMKNLRLAKDFAEERAGV